ncbi:pre-16S rRNA-processing nuclease YqgF [Pannus brasiliensis CCIBt3594]|uniref:Pre-16S rRNA-processing nuclease YqgF n=1 Tax=Pannus brasiliensis CCIBt3594 TaxID=1427578 RepID=A0AAW9QUT3_9CHRO
MNILGFDPGRDKCGVAVRSKDGKLYLHEVVPSGEAIERLADLCLKYSIELLVMGDQTTAKTWKDKLEASLSVPIEMVDERNSTVEAEERYRDMYPPKGLQKLIPRGMRLPDRPIDDIVAILLIERYLQREGRSTSPD